MRKRTIPALVVLLAAAWMPGCRRATEVNPASRSVPPRPPVQVSSEPGPEWADHTQGLPFVLGYEAGLARARAEGKPAMMFVTTTWCGRCKTLAEESFRDPQVAELLKNFVCVIVDGDKERKAQRKLGATRGYPHVIFLAPDGRRLAECLGYKPVGEFKAIVESALDRAGITPVGRP